MNCKVQTTESGKTCLRIGRRHRQIPAKTDYGLGLTITHCRDALNDGMAGRAGWIKAEDVANTVEQCGRRPLSDPDGSIALHIGVAAKRIDAGTRLSDITFSKSRLAIC